MRPKSEIYTPKRDDEHPHPFHMRSPPPRAFDDLFIKWILRGSCFAYFFWCSNFCFRPELYRFSVSSFVLPRYGVFCYWTLSTSVTGETSRLQCISPECTNWKLDSRKHHILHSLDRTQLIHTSILLRFSQRLVIHDSRAEGQRFMILQFQKQRVMIPTSFVTMIHDSWFRFHPRKY